MQPTDVVTIREIAQASGLSLKTMRTYSHRYEDFPPVWKDAAGVFLYLRSDVNAWMVKHGKGHR